MSEWAEMERAQIESTQRTARARTHRAETSQEVKGSDARAGPLRYVDTPAPTNATATIKHEANETAMREAEPIATQQKNERLKRDTGERAMHGKAGRINHEANEDEERVKREARRAATTLESERDERSANTTNAAASKTSSPNEERLKREAEEKATEERLKREADEKATEERLKREAEGKAKRETEERLKREAEEKAKKETDERLKREAEGKAKRETEERLKREADEKATEERLKREAEEKAKTQKQLEDILQEANEKAHSASRHMQSAKEAGTSDEAQQQANSAKKARTEVANLLNRATKESQDQGDSKITNLVEEVKRLSMQSEQYAKEATELAHMMKQNEEHATKASQTAQEARTKAQAALDAIIKATRLDEARKLADAASKITTNALQKISELDTYTNSINEVGLTDKFRKLYEKAKKDASDAHEHAKKAKQIIEEATSYQREQQKKLETTKTELEKAQKNKKPLSRFLGHIQRQIALELNTQKDTRQNEGSSGKSAIMAKIEADSIQGVVELLREKEKTVQTRLAEEKRKVDEKNRRLVGTEREGTRFIIQKTRHPIQGATVYEQHIETQSEKANTGETPLVLHNALENVGALLYFKEGTGNMYVGVAVPVVREELHETMIVLINQQSRYTHYILITATELQAATALGHYKPHDPNAGKPTYNDSDVHGLLSDRFLEHMFLDDLCNLSGDASSNAVTNFQRCLQKINGIHQNTKSVMMQVRSIIESKLNTTIRKTYNYNGGSYENVGMQELSDQNKMNKGLDIYIRENGSKVASGTYITPIAYYNPEKAQGHQCALLVHFHTDQNGGATIAFADTGETALKAHIESKREGHEGEMAIVAVCRTTKENASGILEFALDINPHITDRNQLTQTREAVLTKCGYVDTIIRRDIVQTDVRPDRHLAVRALTCYRNNIVSHPQRSGTCTFYSILWLIGIADALATNDRAVDFITSLTSATNTSSASQNHSGALALLDSIVHVDKEIKKLAFKQLGDEENTHIAELVASDYARCEWLDTMTLRTILSSRAPTEASVTLRTVCVVEDGQVSRFQAEAGVAESLREIANWIDACGYMFDTNTDLTNGAAAVAKFIHISRKLLMQPVDIDNANLEDGDANHILTISTYLPYLMGQGVASKCTVTGMLIRCARYITKIIKSRTDPPTRENQTKLIMSDEFDTTLPWVAEEYNALQHEAAGITHLLFHTRNMGELSQEQTRLQIPTHDRATFIVSSNEFHREWCIQKETNKETYRTSNPSIFANITENIRNARTFQLSQVQEKALKFIKSDLGFAVLNVVAAILNSPGHKVEKKSPFFVFGFKYGKDVRFAASAEQLMTYDKTYENYPSFSENTIVNHEPNADIHDHDSMDQNMEYMYDATRDCIAQKATPHKHENKSEHYLKITYPHRDATWDLRSLITWVDERNPSIDSCDYKGRSLEYVIKRHTAPLSANAPLDSKNARTRLHEILSESKSVYESELDEPSVVILTNMISLLDPKGAVISEVKIESRKIAKDKPVLTLLMYAYMTIASLTGYLKDVLERQSNLVLSLRTKPPSHWSLSKLNLIANQGYVENDQNEVFVFEASGGGIAKVHNALIRASHSFDHWKKGSGDSTIKTSETTIESKGGLVHLTFDINETKKTKKEVHRVFTGECEWWHDTCGSAVIPVTTDEGASVSGLVVIPGAMSGASKRYPKLTMKAEELQVANAYFDSLPPHTFVVTLDATKTLPVPSTGTDELARLFFAYAYSGSRLGTRLMPCLAARSVYDTKKIKVHGQRPVYAHDAIRTTIRGASCPLGCYGALALIESLDRPTGIIRDLRCTNETLRGTLVARVRSGAIHEFPDPKSRARFSFWSEYGEPERLVAYTEAHNKETKQNKRDELERLRFHTDEWMTTLSATTGRFVREDQRAKIGIITEMPWSVVQMNMGFGKSSVIVPMLVARYVCRQSIKIVFVTQPPHLVPQAARTVGALIAAHPFVSGSAVYTINGKDMERLLETWAKEPVGLHDTIRSNRYKLVVVLSTSEMQCIVRDHPLIYTAHVSIAHIADEVDTESDPLKCEVIIEGKTKQAHYHSAIASNESNMKAYYKTACDIVFNTDDARESVAALDEMCKKANLKVLAGTRLRDVYEKVKKGMVHRVNFGMSDDPDKIVAVPFEYSGVPSLVRDFSDLDVAIVLLIMSIMDGMRESDQERLFSLLRTKFKTVAVRIIEAIMKTPRVMHRLYLTQIALPYVQMSPKEISVSFVDLLGCASTLVGFSGTMGTQITAPNFGDQDQRFSYAGVDVDVINEDESNEFVDSIISKTEPIFIPAMEPGIERANAVIHAIQGAMSMHDKEVCIVDGSGEFGAFKNDIEELKKVWPNIEYFKSDGTVDYTNARDGERRVRYYSHRNSRGTDSEMDTGAVGYTIMSQDSSPRSDIAQAIFRLRKIKEGQKVVLVVVKKPISQGAADADISDGKGVLERLYENERAYRSSSKPVEQAQMAHAQRLKATKSDFERDVVYENLNSIGAQKQQETQKQNEIEVTVLKTMERQGSVQCYEKTTQGLDDVEYDTLNLRNTVTDTEIKQSLIQTGIGLSPMITMRDLTLKCQKQIRRAFALCSDHIVVITIVEAWARYRHDERTLDSENDRYTYYTHDGKVMFTLGGKKESNDAGQILLGRFLCDDGLSIYDEIRLLFHLEQAYTDTDKKNGFIKVVECLFKAKFITGPYILLSQLDKYNAEQILEYARQNIEKIVMEVVKERDLYGIVEPGVKTLLNGGTESNKQSFGRRSRRAISLFI